MPWKMEKPMDQKIKLISNWLEDDEDISELARRYSISRKTVYKWIKRYEEEGIQGLEEKERVAHSHPNITEEIIINRIINFKLKHMTWGPKKLMHCLREMNPEVDWPADSTAGYWLKKNNLVKDRKKRRHVQRYQDHFIDCENPNDVWSADYKGQFYTRDKKVCYPLTITDNSSRYILACEGLEGPRLIETKLCFERVFKDFGLPLAIRTDNGTPFAGTGIGGLSRLSIWWIKLGIIPERIDPGEPQQNGRHERMHKTLKEFAVNPKIKDLAEQQGMFDFFRYEFNNERPHESIGMKRPVEVYKISERTLPDKIKSIEYPDDFLVRSVKHGGEIRFDNNFYFISGLLYKERVGLKEIADGLFQINFGSHKLGYIDLHQKRVIRYLKKV